ncbi:glycoside hydrolase family 32 protein [Inquilinus sp. KBS0705]|nr:glycoside hydrolase family 32 protein [Inquilinus sp. KBS0705]
MSIKTALLIGVTFLAIASCKQAKKADSSATTETDSTSYNEPYRLQAHWSPKAKWTNDPNGMVYYKGTYHLFYQHFPDSTVWGPMHWGHATSTDLVHWKQQPIALYPDSLGYIFSGSVVVDEKNTSGFGKDGKVPLVAIFTHHDPKGEKAGTSVFQNQSLAYSLDEGQTWTKYAANPVLKNPGIKDFRDPKVFWYAPQNKWVMNLATKDRITFYSSADLKSWTKESEFGEKLGAHGGVWECPDMFPLKLNGKEYWVLLVSINPGGTNGGSATQYFVGEFDGHAFTPADTQTKWIDYGPDDYAGVTWGNTGDRKIFLGWMGNWLYANQVPTVKWRNAMTIPRELSLKQVGNTVYLASAPVQELDDIVNANNSIDDKILAKDYDLFRIIGKSYKQYDVKFNLDEVKDYTISLLNSTGDTLIVGYNKKSNHYYVDRTKSGLSDFSKDFATVAKAPRIATTPSSAVEVLVDASSIEVFADGGLTNFTAVFFPKKPYTNIRIAAPGTGIKDVELRSLKSIWK